jgi:hypothetical protein
VVDVEGLVAGAQLGPERLQRCVGRRRLQRRLAFHAAASNEGVAGLLAVRGTALDRNPALVVIEGTSQSLADRQSLDGARAGAAFDAAVSILIDLATALSLAHTEGIVHGALSPKSIGLRADAIRTDDVAESAQVVRLATPAGWVREGARLGELRADAVPGSAAASATGLPPRFSEAVEAIERVFGARDRCDQTSFRFRTARDARYRYIRNFTPDRPFLLRSDYKATQYPVWNLLKQLDAAGQLTAPSQKFLTAPTMPPEELYDTVADPHETVNLATSTQPEHAAALQRLRVATEKWIEESHDQGREDDYRYSAEWAAGTPEPKVKGKAKQP